MMHQLTIATLGAAMLVAALHGAENKVWLDELDLSGMSCGWRKTQAGKSVGGNPIKLGGKTFDHADWADAFFVFKDGVRPGSPIICRVPVTGERPMKISVSGLPAGATFDERNATIGGAIARTGEYRLTFEAENAKGRAKR